MSNGNCGQQESSCNPLTGVDKMGGRKQPNVQRPSDGSIFGEGKGKGKGGGGGSSEQQLSSSTCGYATGLTVEETVTAQQENKRAGDELLELRQC
ncbi:hypothetical protein PBY51_010721 [Eleginops maclovinus]|uniref:Uncharacterized protein n=1 Tax=Eleginops maclovinus TaxID=56733 RepID=A0AAN7XB42_ELEMC|nr:hypothetical protein PBY51_010721 [Eleginops maclovinus]